MEIVQVVGIAFIATFMVMIIRQYRPEFSIYISIIAGIVIFFVVIAKLTSVIELIKSLSSKLGTNMQYFYLLIKIEKFSRENSTGHICSNNKKITEIVKYIDEHISDDLDYKTISKKFFVTEKYLYKLFKSETGFTLGGYINERGKQKICRISL
mgnify:CR=1 FL=1